MNQAIRAMYVPTSDPMSSLSPALAGRASADGLRIALFSGNYNCVRDGANKALNRLVRHLIDRGAAVRVYSPTIADPAFLPEGELISAPSLPIPTRPEFRISLGLPRTLREDLRRFGPTHVHLSAPDPLGARAATFARRNGVPVIASHHTRFETYLQYYHLGFLEPLARRYLRRFYRRADVVLAPNASSREHLVELGVEPGRIDIWGRGVDTGIFSPERRDRRWRRALGYRDDELVLLFFGRLVIEKGIDCFAQTIAELRRRNSSIRPLIVGSGPAEARMRDAVGDAVFVGHLEGPELGRAVASADILLNPSITEAFGNVNLEAMASGLSVISADVGSARALIDSEETGILVQPTAPKMAAAAARLIQDQPRRRQIGGAAAQAARLHQWPNVLDQVIRAYRNAVPTSRPRTVR